MEKNSNQKLIEIEESIFYSSEINVALERDSYEWLVNRVKELEKPKVDENGQPAMTPKEQKMMSAMIEIWDLLYKVPGCDAKEEITRIAGSIIYADN